MNTSHFSPKSVQSVSPKNNAAFFSRRAFAKALALGLIFPGNLLRAESADGKSPRLTVDFSGPPSGLNEVVLFPFDDYTIPFRYQIQVGMVAGTHPDNPHPHVLEKGGPGSADAYNISFYGTVIRVGDEFRMWYIGSPEQGICRLCYAVSKDGLIWEKPELGFVELNGNKKNNYADFSHTDLGAVLVMHEPEDPNPNRRFKMVYEVSPSDVHAAFSPDGLHWQDSPLNPIIKHNNIEPGGLTKFNGCYYLTGQGGSVNTKRALVTFMSYDFDGWLDAVSLGLRRDAPPHRELPGMHAGEQVHLGAALWNRGNVILGVYGQWHGETNDRHFLSLDLGLVVSNDALHYREPVPDFQFVSAYEINMYPKPGDAFTSPTLEQGQAFENIGDRTFFYYSPWNGGFVCVAKWMRDRLGYFEVPKGNRPARLGFQETKPKKEKEADSAKAEATPAVPGPHFISTPIQVQGANARVFINADGLAGESHLEVDLLNEHFQPLPEYSGANCITITEPGLRQPVKWRNHETLDPSLSPVRIRVRWGGTRPEEAYVYAVYVAEK